MIKYFYRKGSEILLGQSETEFAAISKNDLLWIDLLQPTGDQKRAVEAYWDGDSESGRGGRNREFFTIFRGG